MSGRGRPVKPIAEKLADGTFRADRANLNVPQPSPFDPNNPFDKEANFVAWQMWEYAVPELMEKYAVGKLDRTLLWAYCRFYERAIWAGEAYDKASMTFTNDMGEMKISGFLKIEETSWDRVISYGARLGLDPISRQKIRGSKQGDGGGLPLTLLSFSRDRGKPPSNAPVEPGTNDAG